MAINSEAHENRNRLYWKRVARLTWRMFFIWLAFTVGLCFFARDLILKFSSGDEFSYYFLVQLMMFAYLLILAVFAILMRRIERVKLEK